MLRNILLLLVMQFCCTGCVTWTVLELSKKSTQLEISSVESYASDAKQVTSICVLGSIRERSKAQDVVLQGKQYSIPISSENWPAECANASGFWTKKCTLSARNVVLARDQIGRSCESEATDGKYKVSVFGQSANELQIRDSVSGDTLVTLNAAVEENRASSWAVFLLPISIAADVITSPVQLAVYAFFNALYSGSE